MLIKSKFRDYYDYLAQSSTDSIVWERDLIQGKKPDYPYQNIRIDIDVDLALPKASFFNEKYPEASWFFKTQTLSLKSIEYNILTLVVCDTAYPVLKSYIFASGKPRYTLLTPGVSQLIPIKVETPKICDLKALNSKVGNCVYLITSVQQGSDGNGNFRVYIEPDVPILKDLGFQKIMSAEKLFFTLCQGVEMIKGDPDSLPEAKPPITNKERIESHGLDYKLSFRHRDRK